MPKITKEKIKIDPDFDLNPLVPGDIIVYAEIEMDEPKGTKWLEQFGLNVLSGAFYVRYGMSDKSAEEPGFDLSEDDRALIIEAISEMVQKETGLSPREYYDKNVAEKEKNLEIMKAVISTSLHLTYRDETAPNLTALYKQAQAIREAFEPICPLARDGWGKVLDSIGTYAPCLMRQSSLFVLAYETGDASCRYWDDFVIVNSDENVSVDAIQKCITEYMAGDPPAKADCDYRTMTIDIMDATGYDWHFLDIGLVSINRAYTFWI